jgi:ABC-type sugar transport system permease subunit
MRSTLHHRWYVPYLFILPGLVLYVLWMIYPLGYEFYISFFDWKLMPGQTSTFVGVENYEQILDDDLFWRIRSGIPWLPLPAR